MGESVELGVFPLQMVLLPGERHRLHLFEPRYRQLYADCVLEDLPFVLVRGDDRMQESIGCTARFWDLEHRHADGRLDVVILGEDRVELGEQTEGRLYRTASVLRRDDELDPAPADQRERLVATVRAFTGEEVERADGVALSYRLAAGLPLDDDLRQVLLDERSERRRMALLERAMDALREREARAAEYARRAATNGHVPLP